MYNDLGKSLLIVNPVAQSGKSKAIGFYVFDLLTSKYKQDVDIFYTKHQGHANHLVHGIYRSIVLSINVYIFSLMLSVCILFIALILFA